MSELKTPYLDELIKGMSKMINRGPVVITHLHDGYEKEYQSIKEALKRLGELEKENKDLKRQLIEGAEIVSIKNNSGDINFC